MGNVSFEEGTVDGRNPASNDMVNISLFKRFYTCQVVQGFFHQQYIPKKINMEPTNGGLEDDFPFQTGDFQVPC